MATTVQTPGSVRPGSTQSPNSGAQRVSLGAKLRAPGFYRAAWLMVLGVAFSTGLTWLVRMATGHATFTHYLSGEAILTVSLIVVPLLFLVGIGGFDYWFYWAIGRPTRPEDHSSHGAHSWKDYFRVNTDHKVIGVQYTVTSFFFLLVGGLIGLLMRAELAQPGAQFVEREHLQRPVLGPRLDLDLPVRDPRIRGPGQLRAAVDDRGARHGLPTAERPLLLAAAGRRRDDAPQLLRARRRLRRWLDRLRAAVRPRAGRTDVLLAWASSSRAPPRS